jgi:hypothetical protein
MYERIKNIEELVRQQLYALESISNQVNELRAGNNVERKLRDRLDEIIKTALVDFLITSDFIFKVLSCFEYGILNETDLEFFLQVPDETFNERVN